MRCLIFLKEHVFLVLTEDPLYLSGTLIKLDGEYSTTEKETMEVLFKTHFPKSIVRNHGEVMGCVSREETAQC